ncbi:hypothetical protein HDU99_002148 [Rhizoclosmatium hyalinum]|nr:hypothetical protein HDU99_002148 [Rhizoclosmatium hyalinum]
MFGIVLLASIAAATTLAPGPNGCPLFNPAGELYVFGSPYGDLNLGATTSGWTSPLPAQAVNITALPNRPPFTSKNIICIPSFYLNSALFLNADPNDPTTIHEYFYKDQVWRKIQTTGLIPDYENVKAIMDYDTLVIYAFDKGKMIRLGDASDQNLSKDLNKAAPFSLAWVDANFNSIPAAISKYTNPVIAHAWFNMYFFGVPGTNAGEVWAYRIHYNEWGAAPQPVGATFPSMHGQTATFLYKNASQNEHDGAPAHVAFVPDDYSGLWVVNSYINVTTKAATPPQTGTSAYTRYAASYNILVQYTPDTGVLRFLDLTWLFQDKPLDPSATWVDATVLNNVPKIVSGAGGSSTGTTGSSGTTGSAATATTAKSAAGAFATGLAGSVVALAAAAFIL